MADALPPDPAAPTSRDGGPRRPSAPPSLLRSVRRRFVSPVRALEFKLLWRVLLHGVVVGIAVGFVACAFFVALEWSEHVLLGRLAGYVPLRPAGEHGPTGSSGAHGPLRLWVLALVPALGGLATGLVAHWLAPEVAGGGGDAFIDAFHRGAHVVRARVAPLKFLASVLTLGSGGSGGREGPTMQIGAAVGALVGRALRASARQRRTLLIAGTAAGMAAIFRTPLGAALLAVEVLYRDDFEADALVPAILASVTSYSIFVTLFPGAGHLFAHAPRYPFEPRSLPLYVLMAIALSAAALLFVGALAASKRAFGATRWPPWLRPAAGGLGLGLIAVAWIAFVNPHTNLAGRGVGILGSGYGPAQGAITGAAWLQPGWAGVRLLVALALVKMLATSLTLGSGGSAGDFGPSLAIGGMLGGAFGRAAQIVWDPALDPGAFALVGMAVFYGGLAHAPLSSAVMVCEMTGTYDLLVPLMLAEGVAFVVLRRTGLYHAQLGSRFDSPAHADLTMQDVLTGLRVGDTIARDRPIATIAPGARLREVLRVVAHAGAWQDVFPVVDARGALAGVMSLHALRTLAHEEDLEWVVVAADVMDPPSTLRVEDDLHFALERLLETGLRELPVVDERGTIVGLLDEADVTRAYHVAVLERREAVESARRSKG